MEFNTLEHNPTVIASVGSLIYSKNTKRYLFLLRNGDRFNDTWSIAGGKINKNESIVNALKREVYEEIGFDISNYKLIPLETFTTPNNYFCYYTFLIPIETEFIPILNNEHKGWAWTDIENIPKPTHPGLFKTVRLEEILSKIKTTETIHFSTN